MRTETYTVKETKLCKCEKGKTTYENTYTEPENPVHHHLHRKLESSVPISTTCPDDCENVKKSI